MLLLLLSLVFTGSLVSAAPSPEESTEFRQIADKMAHAFTEYVILMSKVEGQHLGASEKSARNAAHTWMELWIPSAYSKGQVSCAIAGQVGFFRNGCQYPAGNGPKKPGYIACGNIFPKLGEILREKSYGSQLTLACFAKFVGAPFQQIQKLASTDTMDPKQLRNTSEKLVRKRIDDASKNKESYSKMLLGIENDARQVRNEAINLCFALEPPTSYPNVEKDRKDCQKVQRNLGEVVELAEQTISQEKTKIEAELAAAKNKDQEALSDSAKKKEEALSRVKPCADDPRVQTWKKIAQSSRRSEIGYSGQNVMSKENCFESAQPTRGSSISPIEISKPEKKMGDYTTAHCTVSCDFSSLQKKDRKSYNKDALDSNIGVLKFVEYRSTKNDSADIRVTQSTCPVNTEVGKFNAGLEDHALGGKGIYLHSINGQCFSGGSEVASTPDDVLAKAIKLKSSQAEARANAAPDSDPDAEHREKTVGATE